MYQSKIRILIDYFGLSFKYLSGEREGKDTIRDAIVAFKTMVSFSIFQMFIRFFPPEE